MKKMFYFFAVALLFVLFSCTDNYSSTGEYPALHGQITYFQEKHELYKTFPIKKGDIVFVGDDIIDRGIWDQFYGSDKVKNRGIALEGTECTLFRIKDIARKNPSRLFIATGLYDIKKGCSAKETQERIVQIVKEAKISSPRTKIYLLSIVPDRASMKVDGSVADTVKGINAYLKESFPNKFIDLTEVLCDKDGYIDQAYCIGGTRINGAGYEIIAKALEPYVGMKALNTVKNDPTHGRYNELYTGRSAHYQSRLSIFKTLPNTNQKVIMLGNSLTNNCWWNELLGISSSEIINRGISGDTTDGILDRLDDVVDENPSKLYLLSGVNDLLEEPELTAEELISKYTKLIEAINRELPNTDFYIQSTLPLNPITKFYPGVNEKVAQLNLFLKDNAVKYGYSYVDIGTLMMDEKGDLSSANTCDGIHLLPAAYHLWKKLLQ